MNTLTTAEKARVTILHAFNCPCTEADRINGLLSLNQGPVH
jgi:hypothetical protein